MHLKEYINGRYLTFFIVLLPVLNALQYSTVFAEDETTLYVTYESKKIIQDKEKGIMNKRWSKKYRRFIAFFMIICMVFSNSGVMAAVIPYKLPLYRKQ